MKRLGVGWWIGVAFVASFLHACGSGGSGPAPPVPARSFLMGSTPFFATPTAFPDWRFENLDDKDLLSLHVDDFWGVPWDQCDASGCTPPAAWVAKWTTFANDAKSKGKTLYLALSPLGARKTLAARLDSNGNKVENWAPVDANGCYPFASDADATTHRTAYISYLRYLVNLVGPAYLSPAVEINIPFTQCPLQKTAWIAWYTDVHHAVQAAYPTLPVFATFQMEHLYGIADSQSACNGGVSRPACFDARLAEALSIPGDRIAFSTYPFLWKYLPDYSYTYPPDTYARVRNATARKIWISETGWAAVKILQSYPHGASGSCGADRIPASIANDAELGNYLGWLLGEAQSESFETVIWWLNRDYLDGAVAATCPCDPATSDTCVLSDIFHGADPVNGDLLLRLFGNMALRRYDGSARSAHGVWREYIMRPYAASP
jgi:hypothetical protein